MVTKAHEVPDEVLKAARSLAEANRQAEPHITHIYLAPDAERVLLVEVDPTGIPNDYLGAVPMYFNSEPAAGIPLPSGIVMVTPEEAEREIKLPTGWGEWRGLIPIWPEEHQE